MRLGYLCTLVALILLCACAGAITIGFDKESYKKGESLTFGGECEGNEELSVSIDYQKKVIYEAGRGCEDGSYVLSYDSSFLDPAGSWSARVSGGSGSATVKVDMEPLPISAYYLITFVSPTRGELRKTEDVEVRVKVTDAGVPVEDAQVVVWDVDGRRQTMQAQGDGVYTFDYEIRHNTTASSWGILVTAQKAVDGSLYGGEGVVLLAIRDAPIAVQRIQPAVTTFELGEQIPISFRATYFNGKELVNPEVWAEIGDQNIALAQDVNSTFVGEYYAGPEDLGGIVLKVYAEDDSGNGGTSTLNIVTFAGATWFVKANLLYIIIAIVVVAVVAKVAYSKSAATLKLRKFKDEKRRLIELMKVLQRDYFEKATMPRRAYEKSLAEYKARLSEVNKKISSLENAGEGKSI